MRKKQKLTTTDSVANSDTTLTNFQESRATVFTQQQLEEEGIIIASNDSSSSLESENSDNDVSVSVVVNNKPVDNIKLHTTSSSSQSSSSSSSSIKYNTKNNSKTRKTRKPKGTFNVVQVEESEPVTVIPFIPAPSPQQIVKRKRTKKTEKINEKYVRVNPFEIRTKTDIAEKFRYSHHVALQNLEPSEKYLVVCLLCENSSENLSTRPIRICDNSIHENLRRHLETKHKALYDEILAKREKKKTQGNLITNHFAPISKYQRNSSKQIKFDNVLLYCIVNDGLPLNFSEGLGICALVESLDPKLIMKKRKSTSTRLEKWDTQIVQEKLLKWCAEIHTCVIVLDLWTSKNHDSIMGVQAVTLNEHLEKEVKTIGIIDMPDRHTGDYIKINYDKLIESYHLKEKVTYIMADKGSNVVKAFKNSSHCTMFDDDDNNETVTVDYFMNELDKLENMSDCQSEIDADDLISLEEAVGGESNYDELDEWTKLWFPKEELLSCNCHSLYNTMKNGIQNNEGLLEIVKSLKIIINFFNRRVYYGNKLRKESGKSLLKMVDTRWKYIINALTRILDKDVYGPLCTIIVQADCSNRDRHNNRKSENVPLPITPLLKEQFQEILRLMKPLGEASDALEGDGPTGCVLIPTIITLYDEYLRMNNLIHFEDVRYWILNDIKQRFEQELTKPAYVLASVLHPGIKLAPFPPRDMLPEDAEDSPYDLKVPTREQVLEMCHLHFRQFNSTINVSDKEAEKPDKQFKISSYSKSFSFKYAEKSTAEFASSSSSADPKYEELNKYINTEPRHDTVESKTDKMYAVKFWKSRKDEFKFLYLKARIYLSVPASSASIERLFSILISIGRARRSRISPSRFQQIIQFKENVSIEDIHRVNLQPLKGPVVEVEMCDD